MASPSKIYFVMEGVVFSAAVEGSSSVVVTGEALES